MRKQSFGQNDLNVRNSGKVGKGCHMCYETSVLIVIDIHFFDEKMHFNAQKIFSLEIISSCVTLPSVLVSFTITWLLP